jgi:membrane protease YdiL (CAAX protease family)
LIGGALLEIYEAFIAIFTFLLINTPVFVSLYVYVFKDLNLVAKLAIGVLYWVSAFFTHELVPFVGVIILLFRVHRKTEDEMQARDINIWAAKAGDIVFVAGITLIFKVVINQINKLYVYVLNMYFSVEAKPQEIIKEFVAGEMHYKLFLFVLVVILAPFVEEYIFRYYIYDKLLLKSMPSAAAAIISTTLFTILHFNLSGIPTFFGLGLYCTFIYERKGFYGAVTAHMVSNLVTAVFLIA